MTDTVTPQAATLHLGGTAHAHPALADRLQPISSVTLYPGNPRRGDQDSITSSIRDLGLYAGIIIQADTGHVLVGNHRLRALLELGAEQVPVDTVHVDNTTAAAIVARDNLTSRRGYDDPTDLLALLSADESTLALSGYAEDDLSDLRRAIANADFAETAAAELAAGTLGTPVLDVADPVGVNPDAVKVTVTVDPDAKEKLYALLHEQPWVQDVADAHTRSA